MANGEQKQDSRQSSDNPGGDDAKRDPGTSAPQSGNGIGSSQGQDRGRDRNKGAGTADIERGSSTPGNGTDSLVNDPTGAFKERP